MSKLCLSLFLCGSRPSMEGEVVRRNDPMNKEAYGVKREFEKQARTICLKAKKEEGDDWGKSANAPSIH